jgi:hypothetical protein
MMIVWMMTRCVLPLLYIPPVTLAAMAGHDETAAQFLFFFFLLLSLSWLHRAGN